MVNFIWSLFVTCLLTLHPNNVETSLLHRNTNANPNETLSDTFGREFVFNFPTPWTTAYQPIVMITTLESTNVHVTVAVTGNGYYEETVTTRNQHAEIWLPTTSYLKGIGVQGGTVIVRSSADASVVGLTTKSVSPDAFLVIPTEGLGTSYCVASYLPYSSSFLSEFSVSALDEETNVQIVLSDGKKYNVSLNSHESFQMQGEPGEDLTGSFIHANEPVAFMSGTGAAGVPPGNDPDMLLEHLPPVKSYGYNFILAPFLGRDSGYLYRIIATMETNISLDADGGNTVVNLHPYEWYEANASNKTIIKITSNQPIMVIQYMMSYVTDNSGDPSMVVIPPVEFFAGNVTFPIFSEAVISGFKHWINIITNCGNIPQLIFDRTLSVTSWDTLTEGNTCVCRGEVLPGTHTVEHPNSDAKFWVSVYGFKDFHSYVYPAGFKVLTDAQLIATTQPGPTTYPSNRTETLVQCSDNIMIVYIPRTIIGDVDAGHLHFVDPEDDGCFAHDLNNTHVKLSTAFDKCGTVMAVIDEHIVFSNIVIDDALPVIPGNIITRDRDVKFPIECRMAKDGISSLSFNPDTSTIIFEEEGYGKFSFQLYLYPNQQYLTPYPPEAYPIDVQLKDRLYFETVVAAEDGLELSVSTCVATVSANPYSSPQYNFLEERCSKDNTLVFYPSSDPLIQLFGLEAFAFVDMHAPVYVHCYLILCNVSDSTSRCALGCQSSISKRDISTRSGSKPYLMTEGPLNFIESERSLDYNVYNGDSNGIVSDIVQMLAYLAVVAVCVMVTLGIAVKYRRNKKLSTTTLQYMALPSTSDVD